MSILNFKCSGIAARQHGVSGYGMIKMGDTWSSLANSKPVKDRDTNNIDSKPKAYMYNSGNKDSKVSDSLLYDDEGYLNSLIYGINNKNEHNNRIRQKRQ